MDDTPKVCAHNVFAATVDVARLEDTMGFYADIRITCEDCGTPFTFVGVECGWSMGKPMVNVVGTELRCPVAPLTALVDDKLNKQLADDYKEGRELMLGQRRDEGEKNE